MPKRKEPSNKTKQFLEEYVRNGFNGREAYLTIFPNAKESTASSRSCVLLKDELSRKYLREYLESLNVDRATPTAIINGICDIAYNMENGEEVRLKALTQLSKIYNLENININATVKTVQIVDDLND